MSKVDVGSLDNCWNWEAGKFPTGYGVFKSDGRSVLSHRYMYVMLNGNIPEGMHVCHKCDNPSCVNPIHLWLGTQKENMEDKVKKGRMVDISGEKCGTSKLTSDDVLHIRKLSSEGMTGRALAILYNISNSNINHILKCRTWRNIQQC